MNNIDVGGPYLLGYEVVKRMRLALEQMGSIAITDEEGRYVYVSKRRLDSDSLPVEKLWGRRVKDPMVDEVLKTGTPRLAQTRMAPTPNGTQPVFMNYYPLMEDGKCIGVFLYESFRGLDDALNFSKVVMQLSRELATAKEHLKNMQAARYHASEIVGTSDAINQLKADIAMVARTSSNVLIEGETGTGKELVAHSIHSLSRRSEAPFVRVNCSAIPENLMESEFFGYDPGAFTGAKRGGHIGRFERASGGSLFLDEINTLPKNIQPKFLRVLQENEIERVGGQKVISIDTRIISATNCSLEDQVRSGAFREDLYYRLNIVKIRLPPLRERKEDIPLLAETFISQLNTRLGLDIEGISQDALSLLMDHSWPGNVRELQNMIEHAMNYAYEGILTLQHFKPSFSRLGQGRSHYPATLAPITKPTQSEEWLAIQDALKRCDGNKQKAAKLLGISRSGLYEKLKRYQGAQ